MNRPFYIPNKSHLVYIRKSIFLTKNYFCDIGKVHKMPVNCQLTQLSPKTAAIYFNENASNTEFYEINWRKIKPILC